MSERIESGEMWFYRRILKISYKDHITNEEVLKRMSAKRNLLIRIRKQQLEFVGHIMRNKELENIIITGKADGKRCRGRQRMTFIQSLSKWMEIREVELLHAVHDRRKWKAMISDVWSRHGT